MAAINFPNNPNIGDTFAAAGKEWQWDGTSWNLLNVVNSLHAATHESGGSDEVELAQSQIINLTTDLSNKASASSLSNHTSATTNVHGISNSASLVYTNDSRLSDSRTPLVHAASHSASGSDAITVAQSQVTDLTTDLSAKAPLASPTFTGTVSASAVNISIADTATAASHYIVETNSDGVLRPKTLANVQTEIVSNTAMQTNIVSPTADGSNGIRKITMSTSAPTGGSDGDVWLVYV